MAKVKVTYHDRNRDAPTVTQWGIEFHDGKPVTIDTDDLKVAPLALHKWRSNPWFDVEGGDEIKHEPPAPRQVDPREVDPEEAEYAETMKVDAEARKKQAETLAKNAEAMKAKHQHHGRK